MSQSNAIWAMLAVLVLIMGGYFLVKPAPSNGIDNLKNESMPLFTKATSSNSKKMAFMDFMKQGGSYKCSITQKIGDMDTKGTMYMHNGMVRGEYNAKIQGTEVDSTLVVRDGYTYTWSSMAPNMGFKIKSLNESVDKSTPTGELGGFDSTQIGDYDCQPWRGDSAAFDLPKSITFTDIK